MSLQQLPAKTANALQLDTCQFTPGTRKGHYESFFLRANHPEKNQAFWIRYTFFSPKGFSDRAIGEIWAVFFDGERDKIVAIQEDIAFAECSLSNNSMSIQLGHNRLEKGHLTGSGALNKHQIEWDLNYVGGEAPLLLLPPALYRTPLPKAKSLVTSPNVEFSGQITVDSEQYSIASWQGSENHNWGSQHTDEYAWGQVAGFDNAPHVFLECSTARIKLGPVWSPWMTLAVVRIDDKEFTFNTLSQAIKAKAHYDFFNWTFETRSGDTTLHVKISAPPSHFVGLTYKNPPKGSHTCLNSKIARCELTMTEKGKPPQAFNTEHRAAFEILTDDSSHGVTIVN